MQSGPVEGMWAVDYGGGGEEVRMVCGFLESSEFLFTPVFRTLPRLLVEQTAEDSVGALIASTVREITTLVAAATPGTQAVLGRLMELLFVELLRRHVGRLPAGAKGWFAALNDPIVGRALQRLHTEPGHRWTVDELARDVGSSRTVLVERFKALIGRPPIEYLASWRIQLAAERLRVGHESIPEHRRDYRIRIRGGLHSRLQAHHRDDAGKLARPGVAGLRRPERRRLAAGVQPPKGRRRGATSRPAWFAYSPAIFSGTRPALRVSAARRRSSASHM